jgi:hypothetical protein
MIRLFRIAAAVCLVVAITGCSQAPAIDVMGSLFPAWLLCIALGAILTAATHWQLTRQRVNLVFPFLTYPCLAAVYTFTIWMVVF